MFAGCMCTIIYSCCQGKITPVRATHLKGTQHVEFASAVRVIEPQLPENKFWRGEEALKDHAVDACIYAWGAGIKGVWIDELGDFKMTQTADPLVTQMRDQIRRELRHNQKVKALLLREGRQPQGADWVRSKQAQCAILGHVPPKNGMKCYFCGADL